MYPIWYALETLRFIFLPFSLLYQFILRVRNLLYDSGVFGVTVFDIPTISVGNLAFGGTGKTPHIEYLIRLLQNRFKTAMLSRGYKRKTVGYVFAEPNIKQEMIGDEPWQIHDKFKEIAVGVCENRVLGLPNLLFDAPETQLILLDDAYQHRALQPGLNILLTDYKRRYTHDFLVPMGMLREYPSASSRADIIIVSKCPPTLTGHERESIIRELNPKDNQQVYFSFIRYGEIQGLYDESMAPKSDLVLIFTGVANPDNLVQQMQKQYKKVELKKFADHYIYKLEDIENLKTLFDNMEGSQKIILTTEKDRTKLMNPELKEILEKLPIYYQPIEVEFFEHDKHHFDQQIINYVTQHPANN